MPLSEEFRPVRRIVTGENAAGRSIIVSDGATPNFNKSPAGAMYVQVPWVTGGAAAQGEEPAPPGHHFDFHSPGGSVLRFIDFPPDAEFDGEKMRAFLRAHGVADPGTPRHYGFHKTDTIDYAIIIEGEIYALLDEDETLMRAGDVLIQRATNHSWSNRSGKSCRIAFILLSEAGEADPEKEES